jgi:hypothetical protein
MKHAKSLNSLTLIFRGALLSLSVIAAGISLSAGGSNKLDGKPQDDEPNGCLLYASQGQSLQGRLLDGTGIQFIDNAFVVEMNGLISRFGVRPAAYVLDEPGVENGFATRDRYNPRWVDGTVVITLALIKAELGKTGQYNNFTMPAIMAHEFGHIYQFKRNSQMPTKLLELQADYLAGWYMGNREGSSQYGINAFRQDSQSFFEKGDYNFNSPTHHGTPEERNAAILEGYRNASLSLGAVYAKSTQFVNGMGKTTSPAAAGTEISSISSDASTEGQESGSFCPNLRTIVKAGGNGFRSIKGTRDAPDVAPNLWNSTVSVIDKTGCMGDDDGDSGTTVTCYGEGSSDELKSQYEKLVSSTRRCLSNWPEHKSSNFDGDNRMEFSGPNNVKVRVELWKKKDGNLSLSLEVAQEK